MNHAGRREDRSGFSIVEVRQPQAVATYFVQTTVEVLVASCMMVGRVCLTGNIKDNVIIKSG
jgi:hypothetical protein